MQNKNKTHKDDRYHTFVQDAKLIIVPSWKETFQVSLIAFCRYGKNNFDLPGFFVLIEVIRYRDAHKTGVSFFVFFLHFK